MSNKFKEENICSIGIAIIILALSVYLIVHSVIGYYKDREERKQHHVALMGYDIDKVERFLMCRKEYDIVDFASSMDIREEYEKWLKGLKQ